MVKDKTKTTPKKDETENPNHLKYERGNGEFIIARLLTLMCNKLDEMRNHTKVLVEQNDTIIGQNDKVIKLLEDNQI